VTSTDTGGIGGTVTPDTSPSGGSTTVASTTAAETGGGAPRATATPRRREVPPPPRNARSRAVRMRLPTAGADHSAAPWGVMLVLGAMLATRLRRRGERRRRS